MASFGCRNCGANLSVPSGVSSVKCPWCHHTFFFQNNVYPLAPVASQDNSYGNMGNASGYFHRAPFRTYRPSPPSAHGRKRAVLIGINYHYQQKTLKGSVNDVRMMSYLLANRFSFPNESILVLTEERGPYGMPTKYNIQMALRWLVQGCQSGDSLVFFYSGHGSQVPDTDGDEFDGFDEALCPVDYQTAGMILDDEINATIVWPLPHGVQLHAIIDTCKSGTFLDLPFMCSMNQAGYYGWEDHRISPAYKGTSGGTAFCFSACHDFETSIDTTALTRGVATGAMTHGFVEAVQNGSGLTYGRLLQSLRSKIIEAQKLLFGPYPHTWPAQVPQLSSTEKFGIHSKLFVL